MHPSKKRELKNLAWGVAFLSPNIIGFLAFTTIPLIFSLVLAFSNWDLRLHNMFHDEPIKFVAFKNFVQLFKERDFWKFLGNTLFLMMGAPLAIGGSLLAAILLSKDLKGKQLGTFKVLLPGAVMVACCGMLALFGLGSSALVILIGSIAALALVLGVTTGQTVYRTLFYLPNFTSGVAVYILWKKMYSPHTGPINGFLDGPLRALSAMVCKLPPWIGDLGMWLAVAAIAFVFWKAMSFFFHHWSEGEFGHGSIFLATFFSTLPFWYAAKWFPAASARTVIVAVAVVVILALVCRAAVKGREFTCVVWHGVGTCLLISLGVLAFEFTVTGLSVVSFNLPAMAAVGLEPPNWLSSYQWAKPAIMIMGLWGAIGSNNMLLYLAGLSNVPPELEEAAEIDGASKLQKFWHVTWPQLAPVTFFIVVMSVIGGLQGGFEMARTMTQGGPAGSTTTLSYFIYNEGFVTGRLGYSSGISWVLFVMVLALTLFNWRFGSKYVND